jgi:hypothetical protein
VPAKAGIQYIIPVRFTNKANAQRTKPKSRDKARFTSGLSQGLSASPYGGFTRRLVGGFIRHVVWRMRPLCRNQLSLITTVPLKFA